MPTQGQVSLWGEWGVTRIRRRIILRRRCQFAAPPSYRISQNVFRTGSPQATLSGTPFSSSGYQSYLLTGLISKNSFGRYIETADHATNSYLIGLYVGCKLVSSLRLQIGSTTTPNFSSLHLFPHVLKALLEGNRTILDMGCVAADGGQSGLYVWLPYLALRPWIMAAEYFHADYIVAATRPEYQPFYQRALGCEVHSDLRQAPHHTGRVALVTLDFATSANGLYQNLPFLRSTPAERQQLFERK